VSRIRENIGVEMAQVLQAIQYLLSKYGQIDKIKILKLLYLADKYNLLQYGRTITRDDYWALPLGPIGTTAKDILDMNNSEINFSESEWVVINQAIEAIPSHGRRSKIPNPSLNMLSKTDRESLDYIWKHFGHYTWQQLVAYTHEYPEWKQYEKMFGEGLTKREHLDIEDMLSVLPNDRDPLYAPEERVAEIRSSLNGLD
jgi:uncharacterized phage-associated protein